MRCAVCGEVEGHVVHREHAFDAAIPASKVRALLSAYRSAPAVVRPIDISELERKVLREAGVVEVRPGDKFQD